MPGSPRRTAHNIQRSDMNQYDKRYQSEKYYWGKEPSSLCKICINTFDKSPEKPVLQVMELGCGEGRDAVAFAKLGYDVTAIDLAKLGLDKTEKLAKEFGVKVQTSLGNVIDYKIIKPVDVIFSTGTMQYIPKELRQDRFNHFKEMTKPGGYNAIAAFVEKPFIEKAPDAEENAWFFKSGEIMSFYWDWEIIYSVEEIFDCNSFGILHQHAISRVIAKKI